MIDHTGIGVADVSRSAAFYDAALAALGLRRVRQIPDGVGRKFSSLNRDHPPGTATAASRRRPALSSCL